ncbi:hypothetical protein H6G81_22740, partial [Scytonema hofmannii FACHB-248]|nr:hypothetical protein [Scytonema hofmannii FACHB-248]
LNETQQKQAERIFVQLVRPGEGTEDTRRIATRGEVGGDNWGLVSYLAGYQARLVVTGRREDLTLPNPAPLSLLRRGDGGEVSFAEDTVEVVHEALIREWGTLREWMNASRQFRTWQERLKVALREWKNDNHDSGALLRGVQLTVASDWLHKHAAEMTQEEQDFIQVSGQQRDRDKQERDRTRRLIFIGLGSFSVVSLGLAGLAGVGWWNAGIREINSLANTSDMLLESEPQEALKTSLKAVVQMGRTPWVDANTRTQVKLALMRTVNSVNPLNILRGHKSWVYGVSFSPDGKMLASGSADNTLKLWDTTTDKEIKTLAGHKDWVTDVNFSPDGKILASASRDKTVKLWDTSTYKEIKTLAGHKDWVTGVSFSPNGKMLASGSGDTTVKLWNTSTDKLIKTLTGHRGWVKGVSFSLDGKILASGSADKTVKLWGTSTYKEIKTLTGHTGTVISVSFSPNGKMLASASSDNAVKLWDTSTAKLIRTLTGHTGEVLGIRFSPDGKMLLASGSVDNTVRLWRLDFDYLVKKGCGFIGNYLKSNPHDEEARQIKKDLCKS